MESKRKRNMVIGGAAVLAILAGGGAYAVADGDDLKKEKTLTAAETAQAEKAATGAVDGRVVYVEYEEEYGGGYEVEMEQKDGSEVEVYLDKSFKVAGVESEDGEEGKETGYGAEGMEPGPAGQGSAGK